MKMEFCGYVTFSCIVLTLVARVLGCDNSNCNASNGTVCNNQGTCDCGVCRCEGSYSGPTCEECPTCPSPCEIYKDCVGCKIFGTGTLGGMECITKCDDIATFHPVYNNKFDNPDADDERPLCMTLVKIKDNKACMGMFRIGGMSEGYRDLYVHTETDCSHPIPTSPPVIEEPVVTVKVEETGPEYKQQDQPEDAGAVSGTNQGQRVGDNSADVKIVSKFLLLIMTVLSFFL